MSFPTLPLLGLSPEELTICDRLQSRITWAAPRLHLSNAYYEGTQRIDSLKLSLPPELEGLRAVIGWPALGINTVDHRLTVEGFRLPGTSEVSDDLWDIWQTNNLDAESSLGFLDARIYGCSYFCVGSGEQPGDMPVITVESPLSMAVDYDARSKKVTAAYRLIVQKGKTSATLYLPNETVSIESDERGNRIVTNRDPHGLGVVPVVRVANRQRTSDRYGQSDITAAVRSITDAACRKLVNLEIAGELYAAPQKYVLNVANEKFNNPDGTPRPGWETYLGRVLILEGEGEGQPEPKVGQFDPMDPAVFTQVIDMYARNMATALHLPPHYLGLTSTNPASAEAIDNAEHELISFTEAKQKIFSEPLEDLMRIALLIRDGSVDPDLRRLETEWRDARKPSPGAMADSLSKLVASKMVPASSDVLLKRAGFTPAERAQIKLDREREREEAEQDVAHKLLETLDPAAAASIDKAA